MLTPEEWNALWLSLKLSAIAAFAILPPALLTGWLLARMRFRGKFLIESLALAPLVIPPVVTGYLLLVLFGRNGPIGSLLDEWFGIRFVFSANGVVLASAVVAFPLAVRSIRLAVSLVDPRFEEAAATLGFSPLRVFFAVTLPLSWPGILSGFLLAFARSLGEFGATITFAGNLEGITQTLPLAIYSAMQVPDDQARVSRLVIASLLLCALSMGLSELLRRHPRCRYLNPCGESHASRC